MADPTFLDLHQSTLTTTGETLARNLAFNGQCFLIANMFEITKRAEAEGTTHHVVETLRGGDSRFPPSTANAYPPTAELSAGQANTFAPSGYTNLAPVVSNDPAGASTAFSSLIKKKGAQHLAKIPGELLSLLVPTVRLYKVEYASKQDPNDPTRLIPDPEAIPTEREIIFDDFTDPADLDNIFASRSGRVSGTGIKSFQWTLKGVNPAEVDANITAQLKIHFNDVSDIFTDQFRKPLLDKKAGMEGKASFLDLIIYAPQAKKADGYDLQDDEPLYMLYDGVFFEIKAVVGWAVPPRAEGMLESTKSRRVLAGLALADDATDAEELAADSEPDSTDLEIFQEALRNSQTVLFLQLTTHKFDFNQDGTANLVANYRARYDNKAPKDDIFNVASRMDESKNYHKLVAESKENPEAFKDKESYLPGHWTMMKKVKKSSKGEALAEATKIHENALKNRYNRVIKKLVNRLYTAQATPFQLGAMTATGTAGASEQPFEMANEAELYEVLTAAAKAPQGEIQNNLPTNSGRTGVHDIKDIQEYTFADQGGLAGSAARETFLSHYFKVGVIKKFNAQGKGYGKEWAGKVEEYVSQTTTADTDDDKLGLTDIALRGAGGEQRSGPSGLGDNRRAWKSGPKPDTLEEFTTQVPFFFLGDLIDIIVSETGKDRMKGVSGRNVTDTDRVPLGLRDEIKAGTEGVITTDIEFFNVKRFWTIAHEASNAPQVKKRGQDNDIASPNVFFQRLRHGRLSLSPTQRKNLYKPINIASIPIEFNYFLEWYTRTVTSKRLEFYFLNNFIIDVLTQVVRPALSSNCFYGIPPQQTHIAMVDMLVDRQAGLPGFLFGHAQGNFSSRYGGGLAGATDQNLVALAQPLGGLGPGFDQFSTSATLQYMQSQASGPILPAPCTPDPNMPNQVAFNDEPDTGARRGGPQKYTNFKVITLSTVQPDTLNGNPMEDEPRGIYHFVVGADRGLLKKATFSRMDAPSMREARINRNRVAGAEQLRELYQVTIELFGAPMIKPGQLIYISPSPLGFGDPRSVNSAARYLGIGGYHLVTSADSVIDGTGYRTIVKALHQAMPASLNGEELLMLATDFKKWRADVLDADQPGLSPPSSPGTRD